MSQPKSQGKTAIIVVLLVLLVISVVLYLRARGRLGELEREKLALEQALEQKMNEDRAACDPAELRAAHDELETARRQAEEARAQAQVQLQAALEQARAAEERALAAGKCPDDVRPVSCPPRVKEGDNAGLAECQAALQREIQQRKVCEKELNSEIRDTLR